MEHLSGAIEVREYLVSNSSAIFRGRAQILKMKLQNPYPSMEKWSVRNKVNCVVTSPESYPFSFSKLSPVASYCTDEVSAIVTQMKA